MICKPSVKLLEAGIPSYSCSHEETDPRDALPSLSSGLNSRE